MKRQSGFIKSIFSARLPALEPICGKGHFPAPDKEPFMSDLIFVAVALAFFAAAAAYTYLCERL